MSGHQSPSLFTPDAYDVIASAMNESERGRWFLGEHARRNRGPDTEMLLGAIARLEQAVSSQRPPDDVGHLRGNLLDMANAISRTKSEIAAISTADTDNSRLGGATSALDAIVRTTERATSEILGAAEEVQEVAWTLRERGIESAVCDRLDRHATQIYTACSFQDLTAQRTGRIVHTLRYLEDRLKAMIAIWDTDADRVPPGPDRAAPAPLDLCQSDVDRFIDMPAAEAAEPTKSRLLDADDGVDFLPEAIPADDAIPADAAMAAPDETDLPGMDAFAAEPDTLAGFDGPAEASGESAAEEETGLADPVATMDAADLAWGEADPEPAEAQAAATAAEEPRPAAAPAAPAAVAGAPDLDDIDLLSIEEKLALFS